MTAIRHDRKWTGGLLILSGVILVCWMVMAAREDLPWWGWVAFVIPLVLGLGAASHKLFASHPELIVANGQIVIPRGSVLSPATRAIRIPLPYVRSARIVSVLDFVGNKSRWLEVAMTYRPMELDRLRRSWLMRFQVFTLRPFGYRPPAEPFLLFPVPLLEVRDEEFARMVEAAKTQMELDEHRGGSIDDKEPNQ